MKNTYFGYIIHFYEQIDGDLYVRIIFRYRQCFQDVFRKNPSGDWKYRMDNIWETQIDGKDEHKLNTNYK